MARRTQRTRRHIHRGDGQRQNPRLCPTSRRTHQRSAVPGTRRRTHRADPRADPRARGADPGTGRGVRRLVQDQERVHLRRRTAEPSDRGAAGRRRDVRGDSGPPSGLSQLQGDQLAARDLLRARRGGPDARPRVRAADPADRAPDAAGQADFTLHRHLARGCRRRRRRVHRRRHHRSHRRRCPEGVGQRLADRGGHRRAR